MLSDDKKREEYDAQRRNPFAGGGGPAAAGFRALPGGFPDFGSFTGRGRRGAAGAAGGATGGGRVNMNINLEDMLRQFGMNADLGNSRAEARESEARGNDVQASLEITFTEAALGCEKAVVLSPARQRAAPDHAHSGRCRRWRDAAINLARASQSRRWRGGNLLVKITVRPHGQTKFRRRAPMSRSMCRFTSIRWCWAARSRVQTMEGTTATLKIPAGTPDGTLLRLRGKGRAIARGSRGDLYGVLQVIVPGHLARGADLLKRFAELTRRSSA